MEGEPGVQELLGRAGLGGRDLPAMGQLQLSREERTLVSRAAGPVSCSSGKLLSEEQVRGLSVDS